MLSRMGDALQIRLGHGPCGVVVFTLSRLAFGLVLCFNECLVVVLVWPLRRPACQRHALISDVLLLVGLGLAARCDAVCARGEAVEACQQLRSAGTAIK